MAIIKKKIENLKPGKEYVLTVRAKNSDLNVLSDYSDTIRFQVPTDTTTPSALTNLQLFAGLENVMFVFDYSQDLDVGRYEYELYQNSNMSDEGGPLTGFADANVFTVRVSNLQLEEDGSGLAPFWGRARAIDTTGNAGPWTSLVQTDPHTPLIDNQYIGSLTADKITAGTIGAQTINLNGANSIIQSTTYDDTSGTQGWQIRGDGHFSLGGPNGITYDNDSISIGSDVQVTANLAADSITVGTAPNQLKINDAINGGAGGMTIGDPTYNYWYSNGQFRTGNATNYVLWNGTSLTIRGILQFADGTTPGTFDNGDAITGGSIAGLTISSTKMYIGTGTFNNANTAFYVDNAGKLSLKDKLSWNGTTLTVTGNITGSTITGSTLKTASTGDRVEINSNDIYLYNTATSTTSIKFDGAVNAFGVIQSLNSGIQIKGAGSTTYIVGAAATSEYQWEGSTGRMLTLSRVTGSTVLTVAGSISTTAVTATGNLNGSQVQLSGASAGYYQYDRSNQAVNWAMYVNDGFYRIYNSVFGDRLALSSNDLYIYTLQVNAGGTALRYIAGGQVTAAASKRSLKNNIDYNISGLSIINKLKPASFTWKKTEIESEEVGNIKALHKNYGFIAEDIAEVDNAISVLEPVINENMTQEEKVNSYRDIDSWIPSYYSETGILALAVKSIQELSERLELLENK